MNEAHKFGVKRNRLKRLVRRLKSTPSDSAKIDRKNALIYELGEVGKQIAG